MIVLLKPFLPAPIAEWHKAKGRRIPTYLVDVEDPVVKTKLALGINRIKVKASQRQYLAAAPGNHVIINGLLYILTKSQSNFYLEIQKE